MGGEVPRRQARSTRAPQPAVPNGGDGERKCAGPDAHAQPVRLGEADRLEEPADLGRQEVRPAQPPA